MEFRAKLQGEDIVDKPWADKVNWSMRMNAWQLKYDNTRPQPWLWNPTSHSDVPRCAKALRGITLVEARLPSGAGLIWGVTGRRYWGSYTLPATSVCYPLSQDQFNLPVASIAQLRCRKPDIKPAILTGKMTLTRRFSMMIDYQNHPGPEKKAETPVVHWQNSRIFVRQDHGRWPLFQLFQMKQLTLHPWHVGQGAWVNISTPLNRFCNELC